MIFVDVAKAELPEDWLEVAETAKNEVCEASEATRAEKIVEFDHVWGGLKDPFGDLSDDKCWYCETPWNRDDFALDHYRPKRAVMGDEKHKGYYWLSFKRDNLIFSCKYCNERRRDKQQELTGGKGSFFPLGVLGVRAYCEDDELADERPLLLSPTKATDPSLIAFRGNGEAFPALDPNVDPHLFERGKMSVELYHLNHYRLTRARLQILAQLRQYLERAEGWFRREKRAEARGDIKSANLAKTAFDENMNTIAQMADRSKPYAGAVRSIIRQEARAGKDWLSCLLPGF